MTKVTMLQRLNKNSLYKHCLGIALMHNNVDDDEPLTLSKLINVALSFDALISEASRLLITDVHSEEAGQIFLSWFSKNEKRKYQTYLDSTPPEETYSDDVR